VVEEEPVVATAEAEAAAAVGPEVIKEKKVEGETATPAAAASKGAAPKAGAPKEKEQKK
jgi:hypothetical protein